MNQWKIKIEQIHEWNENEDTDAIKKWIDEAENIEADYSEVYDEYYYEEKWSEPFL